MDANGFYPLVCLPAEQGTLVPVATALVDADAYHDYEPDLLALLWHCCCQLALLFWLALLALRHVQRQLLELSCQANYWRSQHQRAVQREAALAAQVHHLQGEIRELKRRLYGRKSETSSASKAGQQAKTSADSTPRRRGQQPGSKGHGRRQHDHLPTRHEDCALPDHQQCCGDCGEPFEEIPGTQGGDILEVDVRAHRRRYHRQRYRRRCTCAKQPALITAPPPDKLIPKSNIGISLWVLILKRKFEFFLPLHRILAELRGHDLNLPAGTITGGLQKLAPLFEPL